MWIELTKQLANFKSTVLTGVDAYGYPFSIRCIPEPEAAGQTLRVVLPEYACIQPGPAGLLCHKHDDQLWNLASFTVRGSLERDANGWSFRPKQFISGPGIGESAGMLRLVREGRGATKKCLSDRALPRPKI